MTPFAVEAHIRNRYMRGKCAQFAMPAATSLNMELWAMRNKGGGPEHVFAYDPARDVAIDVRGVMCLDEIPQGSSLEESGDEIVFSKIAKAEIRRLFGADGVIEGIRTVNKLMPQMDLAISRELLSRKVPEPDAQDNGSLGLSL